MKKMETPAATVDVDVHGERLGLYIVPESEVVSLARPPQKHQRKTSPQTRTLNSQPYTPRKP
jgi:hypothetical protein